MLDEPKPGFAAEKVDRGSKKSLTAERKNRSLFALERLVFDDSLLAKEDGHSKLHFETSIAKAMRRRHCYCSGEADSKAKDWLQQSRYCEALSHSFSLPTWAQVNTIVQDCSTLIREQAG